MVWERCKEILDEIGGSGREVDIQQKAWLALDENGLTVEEKTLIMAAANQRICYRNLHKYTPDDFK